MQVAMDFEAACRPYAAGRGGQCVLPRLYFFGNRDRHHEHSTWGAITPVQKKRRPVAGRQGRNSEIDGRGQLEIAWGLITGAFEIAWIAEADIAFQLVVDLDDPLLVEQVVG